MIRPQESDFGLAVRLSLDGFDKIRFEDHMASTGESLARSQLGAEPSSPKEPPPHTQQSVVVTQKPLPP